MKSKREQQKRWNAMQKRSRLKSLKKPKKRKRKKTRISKITGKPIVSRQKRERELWALFSLYIRQRDRTCVLRQSGVCGGALQAGHVIGRTKIPTKYAEDNVFGQCAKHNWMHRYHPQAYYSWYIKKFGKKKFLELVERSEKPGKVLSKDEIEKKIAYYESKVQKP